MNQNENQNEIVKYAKKGALSRNDKCPCGSNKKVKQCHKHFLNIRHFVIQREIDIINGLAFHNRQADAGKENMQRMTRQQYLDTLVDNNTEVK